MAPALPKGIHFVLGSGNHKYTAILPDGKRVSFGHRDYEHYKDSVPSRLGGGKWTKQNHLDPSRRKSYRARHSGLSCKDGIQCISVKYSPAWFSYHFLW
jgi:hypothetical protein